jgi:DNA-binding response OmpR family regulator
MNIICIEPDVVLARVYKKVFTENATTTCRICLDPQAAIEQTDAHRPDCIVMELQLAPLSGFAFLQELRSYEDFSTIPVIIYSSVPKDSFATSESSWRALGVQHYFYKSTTSVQTVAKYIQRLAHAD